VHRKAGATELRRHGLDHSGPELDGSGGKIQPGLPQDVRCESPFPETMKGGGSPVPRMRFPKDVDSPHSGNPPRGQGRLLPES
jgi:hypothetical protein